MRQLFERVFRFLTVFANFENLAHMEKVHYIVAYSGHHRVIVILWTEDHRT